MLCRRLTQLEDINDEYHRCIRKFQTNAAKFDKVQKTNHNSENKNLSKGNNADRRKKIFNKIENMLDSIDR